MKMLHHTSNYPYRAIDAEVEKKILKDFNNQVIQTSPEYQTNLNVNTPTNRIITSRILQQAWTLRFLSSLLLS
ncbi:hypothetical protein [Ruminococcus sp.]|uniref:hypothetical protein n=1 Tax=Ruminococcus sp. TaxID=41978 RepID=UPI0025F2EF00|nr:hypothetical protein [Ruminococcus sp.]